MIKAHSRVRYWGGATAVLAFAAAWFGYGALTSPDRVRHRCEQYLKHFVNGDVIVESARFSIFDGIHLGGVRVSETNTAGVTASSDPSFFYCDNLLLKHDPLAILTGRLAVEEVVAVNPLCHFVRTDETGEYNLSRIFRVAARPRTAKKPKLPVIRLRNASLVLSRENGRRPREVDRINLSVLATPVSETTRAYSVVWKRRGADVAEGQLKLDLRTLSFKDIRGGMPWLSLETAMLVVATQFADADRWFSLLGLGGQFKAEGYEVALRADGDEPTRLTLRLRDGSLSVPIDEVERSLPRGQRYLRFDDVEGVVELSEARADLRFTGTFHGARCRVSATLAGAIGPYADLDDVSVAGTITCENFTLPSIGDGASPAAVRFVRRWRPLRSFYNDFNPHGRVTLDVSVAKDAGDGQPVRLERGVMTVLHADGTYRKFPYRVDNITGAVEVTPERIYLRELSGDHNGAPIVVNGWLAEARWYAESELHITGQGVDLDADLRSAINERYRELWDTFELAGGADITVNMARASGTAEHAQPYATVIDAELREGRARFAGLPYPVEGLSGRVSIADDRLTVTRLTGHNGAARVVVDGHADLAKDGLADLNLRLNAEGVAFDDQLFAALPEDAQTRIAAFAPRGTFDLTGDITFDPSAKRATYDLAVALCDARMTYREIPVPIEGVSGTIRLQPHRLSIQRLTGRRGESTVTIRGAFSPAANQADAHAVIECENLIADEALLAALPANISNICRELRITGSVKTVTHFESQGSADASVANLRTTIDTAGASIDLAQDAQASYPLTIARGTVTVEPGRIAIDDLRASHGDTHMALDGAITFDDEVVEGDFALSGQNIVLDEELRLALPWRWRRSWNKLALAGTVDLEMNRLRYVRGQGASSSDWDFEGRLAMNGIAFDAGMRIAGTVGVFCGRGSFGETAGGLSAAGKLTLDSVVVNDRRAENVRGKLEKSAEGGFLILRDLAGELYGGLISATVRADFEPGEARYDVSATMQDVNLRDFLRAERADAAAQFESVAGSLDAYVFLNGSSGDPKSKRGGGRINIRNASLYELPLIAAILNVINFTIPEDSAFQEMSTEFFVTGRRVEVRDLILQGTALALIGSGTIVPADKSLTLKLVAVTPHRWVQVPVITEFLEGASREMLEIDVRGPLGNPVIQAKPLRSIEAAFDTLFDNKKIRKRPPVTPTEKAEKTHNTLN